ncbi:2865_t:CDS:2 [Entrophospora sp. SA101]|nr:2865_t:CDS:2 [Entrophospora sp. SA101]
MKLKTSGDICEIVPSFLYLSSNQSSKNFESLQHYKITHIVNVAGKQHVPSQFIYLRSHFPDSSDAPFLKHLPAILEFIESTEKLGGKVLVQCSGGVSRSPAVVAAWLIKKNGMQVDEAIEFIKERRPGININKGFLEQLNIFRQTTLDISKFKEVDDNNEEDAEYLPYILKAIKQ